MAVLLSPSLFAHPLTILRKPAVCHKLAPISLEALYESLQSCGKFISAVVSDYPFGLILRMGLNIVELPRVEVGCKVAVSLENSAYKVSVEPLREVVQRKPEERDSEYWGYGDRLGSDGDRKIRHRYRRTPSRRYRGYDPGQPDG